MTDAPPSESSDALKLAKVEQALIIPLAALILDGGGMFLISIFAAAAFWCGVLLMRRRRRLDGVTRLDLFLFRWGYFLLLAISFFLAPWIWKLKGL
jgi:hypothetical protein